MFTGDVGADVVDGVAGVEGEDDVTAVFDVELDEIVVIVVGVEDDGARVEGADVDEDVLLEEAAQGQVWSHLRHRRVGFHERRRRPESQRI